MKKFIIIGLLVFINGCTGSESLTTTPEQVGTTGTPVDSTRVLSIIAQKCTVCHSQNPTLVSGGPAGGITFDTTTQIINRASQIKREVINTRQMPKNPVTITAEERTLIGQWADQQ